MEYIEMNLSYIDDMTRMYIETFNSPPWNDEWTYETASKRLLQMINCESFYGMVAYKDEIICGMILGCEEQFYNGSMFNIREFCVRNSLRKQGIGTRILNEFNKRLKLRDINQIILFTSKDDETENFYRKRGLESYNGMIMMGKEL